MCDEGTFTDSEKATKQREREREREWGIAFSFSLHSHVSVHVSESDAIVPLPGCGTRGGTLHLPAVPHVTVIIAPKGTHLLVA